MQAAFAARFAMNTVTTAAVLLHFAVAAVAPSAQEPPADAQHPLAGAYRDALARAKQHKAPVLVFVLPPAEQQPLAAAVAALREREHAAGWFCGKVDVAPPVATARDLLLRQVQVLRVSDTRRYEAAPSPAAALFALAVPVFASAERCGARAGETVVLLGVDGRRVAGYAVDLGDPAAFAAALTPELASAPALAARLANVPPAVARDAEEVRRLRGGDLADPEAWQRLQALRERLAAVAPAAAPLFVRRDGDELRIDAELATLVHAAPPLGTSERFLDPDPCPACGMGFVPPALSSVLQLIGP